MGTPTDRRYDSNNMGQGNVIIIQKALGQANIDELLKLSEDYKKSRYHADTCPTFPQAALSILTNDSGELETSAARSSAGDLYEERRREIYAVPVPAALPAPPPPPPPAQAPQTPTPPPAATPAPPPAAPVAAPTPAPVPPPPVAVPTPAPPAPAPPAPVTTTSPPPPPLQPYIVNAAPPAIYRETEEYSTYHDHDYDHSHYSHPATTYRDSSPSRATTITDSSYSSYSSYSPVTAPHHHAHYTTSASGPVIVARDRDYRHHYETSGDIPMGAGALVPHLQSRSRSRSRARRDLRHEIRALEREYHGRERASSTSGAEIIEAKRLSNGGIVLYEEEVETIKQGQKGPRIQMDKKGRMSISVPKYHYR